MKQLKNMRWAGLVLTLATGAAACKVAGVASTSTMNTGGGGSTVGEGGDPGGGAGAPSCPTPADHCLEADDLLVGDAFQSGYVSAQVGKQTAPPNPAGEATFMILADGGTRTSRTSYRTHKAAPEELAVGALVAALDATGNDNVYRAPTSREDATRTSWFVSRIVSVDSAAQGHVIVSGGYLVALDALRIVDGDASPRLTVGGAEDAAFIKPDHWFVSDAPLPDRGYITVRTAVAIQAPSAATKHEGEYLITQNGERLWSRHAWRTRPATSADIKLGAHVIALDATGPDNVYRAPQSRVDALQTNWFAAKITDTSEAFKGVVTLAGDYRAAVSSLRVVVK
ncbi:MAG TPA: hypothetical protein VM734_04220 [Kofleriaceae bacterium]|nr:hypothetical protein [Kofleriaceae bacterium]